MFNQIFSLFKNINIIKTLQNSFFAQKDKAETVQADLKNIEEALTFNPDSSSDDDGFVNISNDIEDEFVNIPSENKVFAELPAYIKVSDDLINNNMTVSFVENEVPLTSQLDNADLYDIVSANSNVSLLADVEVDELNISKDEEECIHEETDEGFINISIAAEGEQYILEHTDEGFINISSENEVYKELLEQTAVSDDQIIFELQSLINKVNDMSIKDDMVLAKNDMLITSHLNNADLYDIVSANKDIDVDELDISLDEEECIHQETDEGFINISTAAEEEQYIHEQTAEGFINISSESEVYKELLDLTAASDDQIIFELQSLIRIANDKSIKDDMALNELATSIAEYEASITSNFDNTVSTNSNVSNLEVDTLNVSKDEEGYIHQDDFVSISSDIDEEFVNISNDIEEGFVKMLPNSYIHYKAEWSQNSLSDMEQNYSIFNCAKLIGDNVSEYNSTAAA